MWKALRGAGIPIVADWIDAELNRNDLKPTSHAWADHWERCLEQSAAADIVLFYAPTDATQCGSLIEIGSALASGNDVWIVSDYEWSIAHHPRCRVFPDIEKAVAALVAMMAGERARRAA